MVFHLQGIQADSGVLGAMGTRRIVRKRLEKGEQKSAPNSISGHATEDERILSSVSYIIECYMTACDRKC
jgi:hypothetical protein